MQWARKAGGPKKNWVMHTAGVLGSVSRTDLLVLYHDTPNGRKEKITQGFRSQIDDADVQAGNVKDIAESVMVVCRSFSLPTPVSDKIGRVQLFSIT